MRIVALSDTHGDLSHVNRIASKHGADAVLHCGDFGFMTHDRIPQIPKRELTLNIKHSSKLPHEVRKKAWDYTREEKVEIIREHQLLGEFDDYMDGRKKFDVPVYAVWGNHEDQEIVSDVLEGEIEIPNLELVTPESGHSLGGIRLFGIGGNFKLRSFFGPKYSSSFYPAMAFEEWVALKREVKKAYRSKERWWLLTHVSPGKEPLLENFGLHLKPHIWFSGHMGPPFPQHYSLFTIADDHELPGRSEKARRYGLMLWKDYMEELSTWFDLLDYIARYVDTFEVPFHVIKEYGVSKGVNLSKAIVSAAGSIVYQIGKGSSVEEIRKVAEEHTVFPSYGLYKEMEHSRKLFDLPFEPKEREESLRGYLRRGGSHVVKGTWYFNLPDVYTDAYVVIDVDEDGGRHQVQSIGHI